MADRAADDRLNAARLSLTFALMLVVSVASASGLDELHAFLAGTHSATAAFRQTVTRRDGRSAQQSSGTFAFERPGRFRWVYEKPYAQVIVGDGRRVWVYDQDLNQVMVRNLDAALGQTPAALLAGDNELENNFTLIASGDADGLAWVDAIPKAHDSQFKSIRIGFAQDLPRRMMLTDAFGQATTLFFDDMKRNPQLAAGLFTFTPPKGADVVGE
ncbi:MAG TPA: outer membrane lipoprotein chaperone LolA [Casimicrobiaceae bacterium]|jgi:outer membrane lipoprotein carrier protein|nr:outer membrane lipoprotein chaperone LolA [Casimicrobiaceae bacterium]